MLLLCFCFFNFVLILMNFLFFMIVCRFVDSPSTLLLILLSVFFIIFVSIISRHCYSCFLNLSVLCNYLFFFVIFFAFSLSMLITLLCFCFPFYNCIYLSFCHFNILCFGFLSVQSITCVSDF